MTERQCLKFVKYVSRKKSLTRSQISIYFDKHSISDNMIGSSFCHGYVIQANKPTIDMNNGAAYIPSDTDLFKLSIIGEDYLDEHRIITLPFLLTHLIAPVFVGVLSAVITSLILSIF